MPLLLLFIAVPLLEITLFIQVGGAIGLGWTLAIVIATAILGAYMVRSQGAQAMENLRTSFSGLSDPTEHLAHGAMILFSGALLLTPGFFTDIVGFALLVPGVRSFVFQQMKARLKVRHFQMGPNGQPQHPRDRPPHRPSPHPSSQGDRVIDGEFEEIDPDNSTQSGPSGWTKH